MERLARVKQSSLFGPFVSKKKMKCCEYGGPGPVLSFSLKMTFCRFRKIEN
jgi:hypothetical protein